MKYSEARQGRIFVIRLEDGDILHECVERLAVEKNVSRAMLIALGGADKGSKLVVGPENGRASKIIPMETILEDVNEISGVGTLFPGESGKPILHMHIACGRENRSVAGCVRRGVKTWHVLEIVMIELLDSDAARKTDPATGFELLAP